jgi:hypothetical protein
MNEEQATKSTKDTKGSLFVLPKKCFVTFVNFVLFVARFLALLVSYLPL